MRDVTTSGPEETLAIGRDIAAALQGGEVILLRGDLGAGKTVLAHGLAQGLGIERWQGSPTFTLVNEYAGRLRLVHVDLYRLGEGDADELGLEEQVGPESVLVLEWPERDEALIEYLPARSVVEIAIDPLSDTERHIRYDERSL
jgi:tRNA threonylcarbamoyladenosine biosynthesis protein TsaE